MLLKIIRFVCYFAFIVVGAAVLAVAVSETFNLCPGFSANTGVSCGGAWYEGLVNLAMGIVLYSLLTLVPAMLAIAGLIFSIVDLVRHRRRATAA